MLSLSPCLTNCYVNVWEEKETGCWSLLFNNSHSRGTNLLLPGSHALSVRPLLLLNVASKSNHRRPRHCRPVIGSLSTRLDVERPFLNSKEAGGWTWVQPKENPTSSPSDSYVRPDIDIGHIVQSSLVLPTCTICVLGSFEGEKYT